MLKFLSSGSILRETNTNTVLNSDLSELPTCDASVDIAFLVDSSGSISRSNYLREKAFIKAVAQSFGISKSQSRAALVLFSSSASVQIAFRDHDSTSSFKAAVDRLPHERRLTRIDKALQVATRDVFPFARKGVHQIAFVITDGEQTQESDTKDLKVVSEPLRKAGVQVLALGVGSGVNPDELRLIVEKDEDVLIAKNFQDLLDRVGSFIKSTCYLAGKRRVFNKLTSVYHASVLLLIMNFVITLSE